MKRKFFKLSALLLGLCASVGFFGNKDIETAKAAKGAGDENWGLIGSVEGTNWDKDLAFTYNKTVSPARYERETTLNAGEEFKIRKDGAWTVEIGYGGNTGGGISTYLSNSNGNFKVKNTGKYLLKIADDNVADYGDKSYGFSIEAVGTVDPTPVPEVGSEVWSLIGSFTGSGWSNDFDLTYNKETARYEVMQTLAVDDQFKIRYNHAWGTAINWNNEKDASVSTYLSNAGSPDYNFKVKTAGTYLLSIRDKEGSTSTPRAKIFSIEPATVGKHTVTYYNGANVIDTVEVAEDGNAYIAKFVYQEGYRLEGWYTDAALTKPYTATEIKADLSLYGKYVATGNFGLYMKNTHKWAKVNVYLWNAAFDHNNTWPGVAMTAVEGTDYYYTEIDGANGYDHIIFNDGTSQTVDLPLADKMVCYVIGEKGASGYTATAAEVRKVIAYIPGDVYAYEELGYTGATATGTGFATISFDKGAVTVKENDTSITASEREAALIERIAKVDTCNEYSKHAAYRNLVEVSGIDGALSLTITDKGGDVTIGDKLDYMEYLDGQNAKAAATSSSHTILAGHSTSLWFVIIIGVLGLGSVLGYYLLSKKRFSK